jgi:hypothetical protein
MDENKKSVQEELAKSVREKGTTKCPKCASLVQWEDSEQYNPDGSKDRYFWCSNDTCELHQRDVVKVSISTGFLQTFQQNFSKIGKGMIGALFGALSMWGYGHLSAEKPSDNDDPKVVVTETEKDKTINSLTASVGDLEQQLIEMKKKGIDTPIIVPSDNSDNQQVIDSLEYVIEIRDKKIVDLESQPKQSQLTLDQTMDLGMYYSIAGNKDRDVTRAKEYLFATLESPKNDLADENKIIVRRLIEMRMKPLMELKEYDRVLEYIKYLPGEEQNIAKAQVYWYYADADYASSADYKNYKKYKLLSLKHYLQSATLNVLHGRDKIDAISLIEALQNQDDSELSPLSSFSYTLTSGLKIGIIEAIQGDKLNKSAIRKFLKLDIMKNIDS